MERSAANARRGDGDSSCAAHSSVDSRGLPRSRRPRRDGRAGRARSINAARCRCRSGRRGYQDGFGSSRPATPPASRRARRGDAEIGPGRRLHPPRHARPIRWRKVVLEELRLRYQRVESQGDGSPRAPFATRSAPGEPEVLRDLLRDRGGPALPAPLPAGDLSIPLGGLPDGPASRPPVLPERASSAATTAFTRAGETATGGPAGVEGVALPLGAKPRLPRFHEGGRPGDRHRRATNLRQGTNQSVAQRRTNTPAARSSRCRGGFVSREGHAEGIGGDDTCVVVQRVPRSISADGFGQRRAEALDREGRRPWGAVSGAGAGWARCPRRGP